MTNVARMLCVIKAGIRPQVPGRESLIGLRIEASAWAMAQIMQFRANPATFHRVGRRPHGRFPVAHAESSLCLPIHLVGEGFTPVVAPPE